MGGGVGTGPARGEALTRRTSEEGRRENGTRGARRGPDERFGGGSVGKVFGGAWVAYCLCSLGK